MRSRIIACTVLVLAACEARREPPKLPPVIHIDVAAAYERHGRLDLARRELELVEPSTPELGATAALALARVAEASGDLRGAIAALERADTLEGRSVDRIDVAVRLGRLYSVTGDSDRAESAFARAVGGATDPARRGQIVRERLEELRRAGTLEARVAAWRRAGDLAALRSLAAFYETTAGRTPEQIATAARELVPILEKLAERGEPGVRDRLQAAYEATGNAPAALALLAAPTPVLAPAERCPQGLLPPVVPAAVRDAASVVESLGRMRKLVEALAETDRLAALKDPATAVSRLTVAARLYWALERDDRAEQATARARAAATSLEDRRAVAWTEAFGLERARKTAALELLHEQWLRGGDECLQAEAERARGANPQPASAL